MSDVDCQLYVILPADAKPELERLLDRAFSESDIACILLQTDGGQLDNVELAARINEAAHHHRVAFLIEDDAEAAKKIGADGVHLSREQTADESSYQIARNVLGTEAIIGGDCGSSRHSAMVLGEQGADYVAFSGSPASHAPDTESPNELIAWWAEMFEVPSVIWQIETPNDAENAARLGVDFVALNAEIWRNGEDALKTIKSIQDRLAAIKSAN